MYERGTYECVLVVSYATRHVFPHLIVVATDASIYLPGIYMYFYVCLCKEIVAGCPAGKHSFSLQVLLAS